MAEQTTPNVEFFFDPCCPWCWMTSRWASEVAESRGFSINWRPISLQIVNEGRVDPHPESHARGHQAARVIAAAGAKFGVDAVSKLYTEIGTRWHPGGRGEDVAGVVAESLAACGLPAELAAAAESTEFDAVLRENTEFALDAAGPDVGVPIISINGKAFFGPVMTPAPTGDAALRLWDALTLATSVDGFYELKRGRTKGPQF